LAAQPQPVALEVVLVSPRNPLNIGAAARAMANFGFSSLSVAAPFAPHWREARSAVGAPDLLEGAKEFASLAEAVAHCTLVLGTGTLTHRKPEQQVVPLPEIAPLIQRELDRGGHIALVFGPEKHGLTREDLSFCHLLVEIPTDPRQPSMNLGQAVAVCLYELATRVAAPTAVEAAPTAGGKGLPVDSAHLNLLAEVIEKVTLSAHYSPSSMRDANRHDLRLLLRRLSLEQRDARRVLGFFRRILHRLKG
jgi:tRNA/rRNA methyltransferase